MRGLILFSIVIVVIVAIFGFWKIRQFNQRHIDIQITSSKLQENLQQNFITTRILGDIRSNLRLYMQSADDGVLSLIRHDAKELRKTLTEEHLGQDLEHLQEIIDILAIRMKSLQGNNEQIPEAEQAISDVMGITIQEFSDGLGLEVFPLVSMARGTHHKIYVQSIISGQISQIKAGQLQLAKVINTFDKKLGVLIEALSSDQKKKILLKLRDAFYWLDEASSTVAAIRLTTLETEIEIVSTIDKLSNAVAQDSLDRNKASFLLMQEGMGMAQRNILFLVISLIVLALVLIAISLIVSKYFILPLLSFVTLLRKLNRMMAGQRKNSSVDESHLQHLSNFIQGRRDEIGEVALAIKDMLGGMQAISFFRQTIEADESTEEIYQRLARIFTEQLNLTSFVIYERLQGRDSMEHVYCQPAELKDDLPEFAMADNCRAKRTGAIVTSYDDPHICNIFPFPDCLDHYCIPMIVGGHVIGVVLFLFSKDLSAEKRSRISDGIAGAKSFIAETLPVLQSKHLAAEMEEMATKDQLTGLFNRRYLETSLDQMVAGIRRRGTSMGILMCDLDYFKQVNDNYGHDAGDAVLSQLSSVLLNAVRSSDLVIRFGGEEFLILLIDCEPGKAADVAENIRQAVENYKFQAVGHVIEKTTSIGVSTFPATESQGVWEAIKFADVALYKAKDGGRNRVEVFEPSMWEDAAY